MSSSLFGLVCLLGAHGVFGQVQQTATDSVERRDPIQQDSTIKPLQVHRIFIVGNRLTRDHIILRELTLRGGDIVFSNDLPGVLDLAKKRLINTRLFNTVDIRVLDSENNLIDLLIDLDERWYTFPSPIFELSDRNFNEWWQNYDHDFSRVNYGLRLYQYNVRGRNETLRLTGQFGFVRRFDLNYRIPYIDRKQKQGLVFDFDYSEAKNLAVQTVDHKFLFISYPNILKTTQGVALTYTYRNSFYQSHSLRVDYRSNQILQDTVLHANENYLHNEQQKQQFGILTYAFTSDHRDYFAYPLKGHHFNFFIQKSGLGFNDDLNKLEVSLSYSKFIPLRNNYYFSANVVTTVSGPDDVPYANYTTLGFKKQFVRGYEVYVIEGPVFFLAKTTFKKLLFSRNYRWEAMPIEQFRHIPIQIYLKTYADGAYVKNYPYYESRGLNTMLTNKVISSIGGGLDVVSSYDLVFRFEYTLNSMGYHGFFFHVRREF
jgi:outer membrane protein assembly factor BamA